MATHPGQITWNQINRDTRWATGAREPMTIGEASLKFRVLTRNRWIEIDLDPSDTYTVRLVSLTRNYDRKIHGEFSGVYADCLNSVIYALTHPTPGEIVL